MQRLPWKSGAEIRLSPVSSFGFIVSLGEEAFSAAVVPSGSAPAYSGDTSERSLAISGSCCLALSRIRCQVYFF